MAVRELRIETTEPYEGGRAFGKAGPYRLSRGAVEFGVDPTNPANKDIVDLDKAERDADGLVGFTADCCILQPEDPASANRRLLYVVANRGRVTAVPFGEDMSWPPRDDRIDPGDGFLLEQGWTIVWCGWQFDVPRGGTALGLSAPEARENGASITGQVRVDFRSDVAIADHALSDSSPLYAFRSYPAADTEQPDAVLTVRDFLNGTRREIDRSQWKFARDEAGVAVADDEHVWLAGGFQPFRTYEVLYRTRSSPVVGTGLLAMRDFVAYLRRSVSDESPTAGLIDHTFAFGASQSGRFLRQFLAIGLNLDETGAPVFDGVNPHIAGGRLGEFNQRFGQPSHFSYSGAGGRPPFSPSPGMGLFDRQRERGGMPRVVITNSGWEYWRGDAALNHIDAATHEDLPGADDVRLYFLAGTDHIGASPLKDAMPLANTPNRLSANLLLRAAFANLVDWVTTDSAPPDSRVPRLGDSSAATREEVLGNFAAIPGASLPDRAALPVTQLVDHGPRVDDGIVVWPGVEGKVLTCYVGAVNEDGNEVAGVRLPELQVPLASYTGWNPRAPRPDLPDVLYEFPGSLFRFAATAEARRESGDPRRAISERYADHETYAAAIAAAVDELVADRLLLASDAARAVQSAMNRF
jgi:hypothetical protein